MLQLCVTAQFYLENKGKYILEVWGHADPKDVKRREREREKRARACAWERDSPGPLAPLFIRFFSSPLGLPYVNWASQECCLLYLKSSLQSSDLPLFYFRGLFPSLSFSHFWTPFSYSNYLTFPLNRWEAQFFGNRGVEVFLATSCWTGMARALGLPLLPVSGLRVLIAVSI